LSSRAKLTVSCVYRAYLCGRLPNRKWYQVTQRHFLHRRMGVSMSFNDSLSVNLGWVWGFGKETVCLWTHWGHSTDMSWHDATWRL